MGKEVACWVKFLSFSPSELWLQEALFSQGLTQSSLDNPPFLSISLSLLPHSSSGINTQISHFTHVLVSGSALQGSLMKSLPQELQFLEATVLSASGMAVLRLWASPPVVVTLTMTKIQQHGRPFAVWTAPFHHPSDMKWKLF